MSNDVENKQEIIDKVNLKTATKLFEEVCVDGYQEIGYYWLSTEYEVDGSYYPLIFCIGSTEWKEYYEEHYYGMSVRLVKDL